MGRTTTLSLRIFQGLLAAANLALSAYVVNWYLTVTRRGAPASLSFLVFASSFSLLSLLWLELAPRLLPAAAAHACGTLSVEATNAVFYFAAFIAHAVFLGGLSMCHGTVCTAGRVDSVVAAAAFCAWIASTIFTAKAMFINGDARRRPADSNKSTQMGEAAIA
ncbi:hypothetical protein CDD83_4584 [Cordyceps sp. RAO-2017]|nr:hypothetical protein CDD83_4584 [Cordyceps sp. RAO-2017]